MCVCKVLNERRQETCIQKEERKNYHWSVRFCRIKKREKKRKRRQERFGQIRSFELCTHLKGPLSEFQCPPT